MESKSIMPVKSKKIGRVLTTASEMRAVARAARIREKTATKIVSVTYDRRHDSVSVTLSTEAVLTVPKSSILGFARAKWPGRADIEITPGREGLWSESVDDGVLLEQLLIIAAGEQTLGTIGARINASKKSPARAAASRANGLKGGRPQKKSAA